MPWIFHDDFTSAKNAKDYGQKIVSLGLAVGCKVKKNSHKKKRPYELYINKGGTCATRKVKKPK